MTSGDDSLNRNDRDATPDRPTNAAGMNDVDIAEMVADWCAMSEEKGGHPQDWAAKNINVRWNFSDGMRRITMSQIDQCQFCSRRGVVSACIGCPHNRRDVPIKIKRLRKIHDLEETRRMDFQYPPETDL